MLLTEITQAIGYYQQNVSWIVFLGTCFLFAAKIFLVSHISRKKSCAGISGKTQILYALIFIARCSDILSQVHVGSGIPLLVVITESLWVPVIYSVLLLIYYIHKDTYDSDYDNLEISMLILPCVLLTLHDYWDSPESRVFLSFSAYLEAVASFPQFYYTLLEGQLEKFIRYYFIILNLSKVCDLAAEVYNYKLGPARFNSLIFFCGLIQLMFYAFFERNFYRKAKRKKKKKKRSVRRERAPENTERFVGAIGLTEFVRPSARPNDYI